MSMHYKPQGLSTPCGVLREWYLANDKTLTKPRTTTNVADVTCGSCLRYIVDTANVNIQNRGG